MVEGLTGEVIMTKASMITRKYFRGKGFWRMNIEEQANLLTEFWMEIQSELNINTQLNLRLTDGAIHGNGVYSPSQNYITIFNKASVMTVIHELRHALQNRGFEVFRNDKELDATCWSHLVFKKAMPNLYQRSLASGLFYERPSESMLIEAEQYFITNVATLNLEGGN